MSLPISDGFLHNDLINEIATLGLVVEDLKKIEREFRRTNSFSQREELVREMSLRPTLWHS